jgi:hypothetical protein
MRLYAASGREHLVRMISELVNRSRRYAPYVYGSWRPLDIALRNHQPLLEAIEAGDPALVEERTREHMSAAAARLLAGVQREADERSRMTPLGQGRERQFDRNQPLAPVEPAPRLETRPVADSPRAPRTG